MFSSSFFFFCASNFLALIILQPEIVKLNFTKSYILVDVMGVLALVYTGVALVPALLCGEVVNLTLWAFYIILTMNFLNRNFYISVSTLK